MIVVTLMAIALGASSGAGEPSDWWVVGRDGTRFVLIDKDAIQAENDHTGVDADVSTYVTLIDPTAAEPIRQQFVGFNCRKRSVYFGNAMVFAANGERLRLEAEPSEILRFPFAEGASYGLLCRHTDPSDPADHLGNISMGVLVRVLTKRN